LRYSNEKIVIVGAGPAAISLAASLQLGGLNYTILEKNSIPGGQLPLIHNELDDFVIGVHKDGKEFAEKLIQFNEKYKLKIEFDCTVQKIDVLKKIIYFINDGKQKSIDYDIAVIATGSRCKKPKKSLIDTFEKDIYYRISYSLPDFVNKKVAVIGGGDNATIAALRLADVAEEVVLINKNEELISRPDLVMGALSHPKIKVFNNFLLDKLKGGTCLNQIEAISGSSGERLIFDIDKAVFKIGYLPNTEFVSDSLELDERGYIKVYKKYETSVKDVFAIGDIVSGAYKRISIVIGHGTDLGNYFLKDYMIEVFRVI